MLACFDSPGPLRSPSATFNSSRHMFLSTLHLFANISLVCSAIPEESARGFAAPPGRRCGGNSSNPSSEESAERR